MTDPVNKKINQIVSLSGGKDSTAMLLMMLERGEPIHSIVFFDTGWEFPQMLEHIDLLEQRTGIEIVRLQPSRSFEYWMIEKPLKDRKGYSWPSPIRRWCTREKFNAINKYANQHKPWVQCIGYAADESERQSKEIIKRRRNLRFPLIEWDVTEDMALQYCREQGYHWSGLYDFFRRVSCFCCPLQRMNDLRKLRKHFPELWQRMLDMDSRIDKNGGFKDYKTVHDLEKRFADEDRQLTFEGIR